jgi:protein-S-isoprenylcysteine O-methyltransferase Ste14
LKVQLNFILKNGYPCHMKGKLLVTVQFVLLGVLATTPSVNRSSGAALAAIILILAAVALLLKSFRDLGDALTPLPESKEGASLVTSGIYKYLRHPIYLALFLLAAGLVLWKQSWQSIAVSILLIGLLIYKSRYEDSLLKIKFPESANYQNSTPAFFLKIRRG